MWALKPGEKQCFWKIFWQNDGLSEATWLDLEHEKNEEEEVKKYRRHRYQLCPELFLQEQGSFLNTKPHPWSQMSQIVQWSVRLLLHTLKQKKTVIHGAIFSFSIKIIKF